MFIFIKKMSELPERKQEEFKELTEEEVKLLHKKERAMELDIVPYLFDTVMISTLLKEYYDHGIIIPEDVLKVLNAMIYIHGYSKMSRFYEDDIGSYMFKIIDKIIPKGLDPRPYLMRKIIQIIGVDKLEKQSPKRTYTLNNNHVLMSSHEYQGEESELPQKITIYRAKKKNKIPSQKRNNKRTLFNNKK